MTIDRSQRTLVDAQADLLRLTVRLSCHTFNNQLTSASIHLYGKPADMKDALAARDALKGVFHSLTKEVESLHRLALGGDLKPVPTPLYDLRDPIVRLVRVAKKNMPVIEADPNGPWAELASVRAARVRLACVEAALAALEIDPKAVVRLRAEAGEGAFGLTIEAPIDAAAFAAEPGRKIADAIAESEGYILRAPIGAPATWTILFPERGA